MELYQKGPLKIIENGDITCPYFCGTFNPKSAAKCTNDNCGKILRSCRLCQAPNTSEAQGCVSCEQILAGNFCPIFPSNAVGAKSASKAAMNEKIKAIKNKTNLTLDDVTEAPASSMKPSRKRKKNEEAETKTKKRRKSSAVVASNNANWISPAGRAAQHPGEGLVGLKTGKIHCHFCMKDYANSSDGINKHVNSEKHKGKKQEAKEMEIRRNSLVEFILNNEGVGEVDEYTSFRLDIARAFLKGDIKFSKMKFLRPYLESKYSLTDPSHMADYKPAAFTLEFEHLRKLLSNTTHYSLFFDGKDYHGEMVSVIVRFWDSEQFNVVQKAIGIKHSNDKPNQITLAAQLQKILQQVDLSHEKCRFIINDTLAVNWRTIANFKNVSWFLLAANLACCSHVVSNVGVTLSNNLPMASKLLSCWQSFCAQSSLVKTAYFDKFGKPCPYITNYTRWYSTYNDVVYPFFEIKYVGLYNFIRDYAIANSPPTNSLKEILNLLQTNGNDCQLELAVYIDYGFQLVRCCYALEGDAILMPFAYDHLMHVHASLKDWKQQGFKSVTSQTIKDLAGDNKEFSEVLQRRVIDILSTTAEYFSSHLQPTIPANRDADSYLKNQGLKRTIDIAKFARILNPERANSIPLDYNTLRQLAESAALPGVDVAFVKVLFSEVGKYQRLASEFRAESSEIISEKTRLFFAQNQRDLPKLCELYKLIALAQPSSGCVERLNALFDNMNGTTGHSATAGTMEGQTLMKYNYKNPKLVVKQKSKHNKRMVPAEEQRIDVNQNNKN
jgi:hypothetical protein